MPIPLLPELRFAQPGFLWLIPAVLLLAALGGRRGANVAVDFGALKLMGNEGTHAKGGLGGLAPPLFLFALLSGVAALARPQKINEFEFSSGEGIEIIIAIDVSYSMSIEDYVLNGRKVNRLEAAKSVIKDFVKGRPDDRIGLVIFSGRPNHLGPLTMSHDWVLETIDREIHFDHQIADGTAIGTAIAAPAKKLAGREAKSKVVVLLTDGSQDGPGLAPEEAAALAGTLDIKVYPIAIGTPGEHYVPMLRRSMDQSFDFESMQKVAEITKAQAFLGKDLTALRKIFTEIDSLEKSEVERRTVIETREYFQWPLAAAALLAILGIGWELGPGRVAPD